MFEIIKNYAVYYMPVMLVYSFSMYGVEMIDEKYSSESIYGDFGKPGFQSFFGFLVTWIILSVIHANWMPFTFLAACLPAIIAFLNILFRDQSMMKGSIILLLPVQIVFTIAAKALIYYSLSLLAMPLSLLLIVPALCLLAVVLFLLVFAFFRFGFGCGCTLVLLFIIFALLRFGRGWLLQ